MNRALIILLATLAIPSFSFGQQPSPNNKLPGCAQWAKVKIPAADLPTPHDRKALQGTFSEDLYFGLGLPEDPVQARKSAYLERESGDPPVFGGSAMLMMIYANGKGVPRNFDLALKFACEIDDPMIASENRIDHLISLRDQHWTGTDFTLCDDAGSTFLVGACTGLDEQLREVARARTLDALIQRWTPADKGALADLQKAAAEFTQASARNEVDTTGTGRASFISEWETWLRDGFLEALQRAEQGQLPNFSAADFKSADDQLNAAYSKIQSAGEGAEGMGDVTPDGVKTAERAWLKLREAWVKFGAAKYPGVTAESWRTWLTYDRIVMLHFVPGPGAPDWSAFHEHLPWRYQYEVGNFREALRLKPDSAPVHNALAEELSMKEDMDGAIAEYREAVRLDADFFDAHEHLAFALGKKNDWPNSAKEYGEVVRLKPNDATWRSELANALKHAGDLDGAIREYREAVRLESGVRNIKALAGALADKQDWDGAIREYRELVRLSPKDVDAYDNLGWALSGKEDWDAAAKEFREALRLDPRDAYSHSHLGISLENKNDSAGALAEYREASRLKPDDADAHRVVCRFLAEAQHDFDAAIPECRESIRLKPDNYWPHGELGWLFEKKKDYDAAIAEDREAIRLRPDWSLLVDNLGWALFQKGDVDAAIAQYREALRIKPDDSQAHLNLGIALDKKGDWDGAIREYREAWRITPDQPGGLHYYVGQALEHKGDKPAALDEYRQATAADPKNADFRAAYDNLRQQLPH